MIRYYQTLPSIARREWPALLTGMGYNFEFYDGMFALMAANVQLSMDGTDYRARFRAMQALLRPFCSEFGIEPERGLMKSHRELFGEFYRSATGEAMPERYPRSPLNPWLKISRRWARVMRRRLDCAGADGLDRAAFNIGYHWAVEHLSIEEFRLMRQAWESLGIRAAYLDAHCEVEEEHARCAVAAVTAAQHLGGGVGAAIRRAAEAHESDLAGYYAEMTRFALQRRPPHHPD